MRTQNKDVLMICKLNYNHRKYGLPLDALRLYIAKYTGMYELDVTHENVLHFLFEAIEEFCTKRDLLTILEGRIPRSLKFYGPISEDAFEQILIGHLQGLTVYDGEKWVIDLTDYMDDEDIPRIEI